MLSLRVAAHYVVNVIHQCIEALLCNESTVILRGTADQRVGHASIAVELGIGLSREKCCDRHAGAAKLFTKPLCEDESKCLARTVDRLIRGRLRS
ncbi:hypothetical protein D3C71_553760 [compost metagenome]